MYYLFHDMYSGGSRQSDVTNIVIEAQSEGKAIETFKDIFRRDPLNVTCECCGTDYSINDFDSKEELLDLYPDARFYV